MDVMESSSFWVNPLNTGFYSRIDNITENLIFFVGIPAFLQDIRNNYQHHDHPQSIS
jgi:hypothetical protein